MEQLDTQRTWAFYIRTNSELVLFYQPDVKIVAV